MSEPEVVYYKISWNWNSLEVNFNFTKFLASISSKLRQIILEHQMPKIGSTASAYIV